jgi:hypothetical protein
MVMALDMFQIRKSNFLIKKINLLPVIIKQKAKSVPNAMLMLIAAAAARYSCQEIVMQLIN